MIPGQREKLCDLGAARMRDFCRLNNLAVPTLRREPKRSWRFDGTCAYYRPTYIAICVEKCATPGYGGRQWSWPGYVVDRTPYGVIQHELGHHVDITVSGMSHGYQGKFSAGLRQLSGEDPITTYCPNDAEWFAEIFRLFVTNPDLLSALRPKTFNLLAQKFQIVQHRPWKEVLKGAQERYFNAAQRKIDRYYEL